MLDLKKGSFVKRLSITVLCLLGLIVFGRLFGCQNCTEAGCIDVVNFEFELSTGESFPQGAYAIRISSNLEDEATVPYGDSEWTDSYEIHFGNGDSDGAVSNGLTRLTGELWMSSPRDNLEEISLTLLYQGTGVGDATIESFNWTDPNRPNGEQCGPVCYSAEETVTVDHFDLVEPDTSSDTDADAGEDAGTDSK